MAELDFNREGMALESSFFFVCFVLFVFIGLRERKGEGERERETSIDTLGIEPTPGYVP